MAAQIDIPLQRNEDWVRRFPMKSGGEPIDMTGWTLAMQVRSRTDNGALIAAAEITTSELAQGAFTVTLRASEGTPLNSYGSPLQTENLPYDLRATDSAGTKITLFGGVVVLSRGVTHD